MALSRSLTALLTTAALPLLVIADRGRAENNVNTSMVVYGEDTGPSTTGFCLGKVSKIEVEDFVLS